MNYLNNMKTGKKIGVVLGGTVVLLVCLSVASLWGLRSSEKISEDTISRLTKSKLAETVSSDSSALAQSIAKMVLDQRSDDATLSQIEEFRRSRAAALETFRQMADSPTSIQHGVDLTSLAGASQIANDRVIESLRAERLGSLTKEYRAAATASANLRLKAKEASAWQEQLVTENEKTRKATSDTVWLVLILGSLLAIAGAIIGGIVLARSISAPLTIAVAHFEEIAKGDLSKDAPAAFQLRGDEIGTLARGKQALLVNLRKMVQELSSGVQVLSSSSTELLASSDQMTASSRLASDKANSVSAAAEEMSSNATSVAVGMEQTSTNLSHVSSATDQMTATITEIASNSEKARRITGDATRQASRITEQINQLGEAAREIGKVTETITEISSQTNLLALNATIEAARAGAAGKGFAVVANEIKALAQQTAAATEDIKARIHGVQSATASGITEVGKISSVIDEVSGIVNSIAVAIEEQASSTKDIARNIAEASTGVADANTRVAETSQATKEIARDTVDVDRTAREMATGSDHVRSSARELSVTAENLKAAMGRFKV